jgi:hypothetical protein
LIGNLRLHYYDGLHPRSDNVSHSLRMTLKLFLRNNGELAIGFAVLSRTIVRSVASVWNTMTVQFGNLVAYVLYAIVGSVGRMIVERLVIAPRKVDVPK